MIENSNSRNQSSTSRRANVRVVIELRKYVESDYVDIVLATMHRWQSLSSLLNKREEEKNIKIVAIINLL